MKFKKLTEQLSTYAIMLRRDGKSFNVTFHPYGTDGPDYTLEYCEWFYKHIDNDVVKKHILDFVKTYSTEYDLSVSELSSEIETPLSDVFISKVTLDGEVGNLRGLWKIVENDLNQQFCRARFGGRYDSDDVLGGEIVFRISSDGFNWFDIIYMYVSEHKSNINYVTIVKDLESRGVDDIYVDGKNKFYRMPINDFLTVSGNPVVENMD